MDTCTEPAASTFTLNQSLSPQELPANVAVSPVSTTPLASAAVSFGSPVSSMQLPPPLDELDEDDDDDEELSEPPVSGSHMVRGVPEDELLELDPLVEPACPELPDDE